MRGWLERYRQGETAEVWAIGYTFEADPFAPASPGVADELDMLEARIGQLPLALRIWFEEVGR